MRKDLWFRTNKDNPHWWRDQTAGRSCTQAGDGKDKDNDVDVDDDNDVDGDDNDNDEDDDENEHLGDGASAPTSASTVHWVWCAGCHLQ